MNRRMERDVKVFWRRLSPRYFKMVMTLIVTCLLFSTVAYLAFRYLFYPLKITFIAKPTTKLTTTTTTTLSTTTKGYFSDLGCFFDKTNITLADGSTRSLDRLTTRDEVLVYSSSGRIQQSRVLAIFHHQRSLVRFLDIYTADNQQPLRLTPTHSILTKKNTDKQSSFDYDFAHNIAINDWILSSTLKPVRVIEVKETLLENQTISTPLTFEGNILVNNLIGSCYATFNHRFMHLLTTPIRYWYQIESFSRLNSLLIHFIDLYSKISFY